MTAAITSAYAERTLARSVASRLVSSCLVKIGIEIAVKMETNDYQKLRQRKALFPVLYMNFHSYHPPVTFIFFLFYHMI